MAINKVIFLIQKSHLQDGKIQTSQSLFAIWMGSFSKLASFLVVVHDFVVEDTEVQSKSKSDWVASIE